MEAQSNHDPEADQQSEPRTEAGPGAKPSGSERVLTYDIRSRQIKLRTILALMTELALLMALGRATGWRIFTERLDATIPVALLVVAATLMIFDADWTVFKRRSEKSKPPGEPPPDPAQ